MIRKEAIINGINVNLVLQTSDFEIRITHILIADLNLVMIKILVIVFLTSVPFVIQRSIDVSFPTAIGRLKRLTSH